MASDEMKGIYPNTVLGGHLLHGLLRHDTSTSVQVYKAVLAVHLLHGDRADVARDWFLVVVGEADGLGL